MKRLKDTSMFSGIKQLNEIRLIKRGYFYDVYTPLDQSYHYRGTLRILKNESNYMLYEAAKLHIERNNK